MEISEAFGFSLDGGSLGPAILAVAAWLTVVVGALLAVRRAWAWPALAGGVVGTAVSATVLADLLRIRSDIDGPSAQVFDGDYDYPGFLIDHPGLADAVAWGQVVAVALLAVAVVTGAVLSRRRARPPADV